MSVLRFLFLMVLWTLAVAVLLTFLPGGVNSPGCAGLVEPPPSCLDALRAMNERLWWTHTLPVFFVGVGGYVAIVALALRGRRSRRW